MWGRRWLGEVRDDLTGFTPTCVGTAPAPLPHHLRVWVHPHVCGDGSPMSGSRGNSSGSPPRVWGRRCGAASIAGQSGFTPTCVGTAPSLCDPTRSRGVHPHVCGDGDAPRGRNDFDPGSPPRVWGRLSPMTFDFVFSGSPPRVWGRLHQALLLAPHFGFTPTCVGTAWEMDARVGLPWVHPHVCGDGVSTASFAAFSLGSPPRVWGRLGMVKPDS